MTGRAELALFAFTAQVPVFLLMPIKVIKEIPHRHVQKPISKVTVDLAKFKTLTIAPF